MLHNYELYFKGTGTKPNTTDNQHICMTVTLVNPVYRTEILKKCQLPDIHFTKYHLITWIVYTSFHLQIYESTNVQSNLAVFWLGTDSTTILKDPDVWKVQFGVWSTNSLASQTAF